MKESRGQILIPSDDYAFLDCGDGRRLERFGAVIVDRPAPAAAWPPGLPPATWAQASLRFSRASDSTAVDAADDVGELAGWRGEAPADWQISPPGWDKKLRLSLRPAAAGQVGVFPEQWPVAQELATILARARRTEPARERTLLTVFAHTGAASLAALAVDGVRVVHVDASRGAVARARDNARLSGLGERPAHWVVDDALPFMRREVRRGNRYDALLFDPPAFGRAPKGKGGRGGRAGTGAGKDWRFARDLPELLELAAALTAPDALFFGLCRHATGPADESASRAISTLWRSRPDFIYTTTPLTLSASSPAGRPLPAGRIGRWEASG